MTEFEFIPVTLQPRGYAAPAMPYVVEQPARTKRNRGSYPGPASHYQRSGAHHHPYYHAHHDHHPPHYPPQYEYDDGDYVVVTDDAIEEEEEEELEHEQPHINRRLGGDWMPCPAIRQAHNQPRARPNEWTPRVDVLERPGCWEIHADLPGVEENQVELYVEGRTLTISGVRYPQLAFSEHEDLKRGTKRMPSLVGSSAYRMLECPAGYFSRSLRLPENSNLAAGVESALKNGILAIKIPKLAPQHPPQRHYIPIGTHKDRPASPPRPQSCLSCGAAAPPLRCGGCHQASFCNFECQKRSWPTHKADCKRLAAEASRKKATNSLSVKTEQPAPALKPQAQPAPAQTPPQRTEKSPFRFEMDPISFVSIPVCTEKSSSAPAPSRSSAPSSASTPTATSAAKPTITSIPISITTAPQAAESAQQAPTGNPATTVSEKKSIPITSAVTNSIPINKSIATIIPISTSTQPTDCHDDTSISIPISKSPSISIPISTPSTDSYSSSSSSSFPSSSSSSSAKSKASAIPMSSEDGSGGKGLECCFGCSREAPPLRCSRCHAVAFCSTDCFQKSWASHKPNCLKKST